MAVSDREPLTRKVHLCVPGTGVTLVRDGERLIASDESDVCIPVVDGVPRFVSPDDNYAESFGYQWNLWENERSEDRGSRLGLAETIRQRTRFDLYETEGKTLLECGMGGGDDTEVLLQFPFSEVHSFDLSHACERAARYLHDDRLTISQASIYEIPYADESFDFVYCHRVLQHTPDPVDALRCICRKVKPGGVLFAHAYKRSVWYMLEWRYKYRWLTKRLPMSWVRAYVERCGPCLHAVNNVLYRLPIVWVCAYNFVPFYYKSGVVDRSHQLALEKLITFDALTPMHDHPMSRAEFLETIEAEGFRVEHLHDPRVSPIYCTAVREM